MNPHARRSESAPQRKLKIQTKGGKHMTLQEFQEQSLELVLQYMVLVYHILKSKKESADVKQKLLATALSLLIYAQEELETMLNNSENSISQDE